MDGTGRRRLALVLGGGGSKGALQVGLYRALAELDIRPDLVVGASVGAVNGAFIAAGFPPRKLAAGWAAIARKDLFGPNWQVLMKGTRAGGLLSAARMRRLLGRTLPARRFEELVTPLAVITTHLSTGEACVWEQGELLEAVLASTAVPGLLAPVERHGTLHIDGALADNLPVETALERGATHVIAMSCVTCQRCETRAEGVVDVLGRAFAIAADCKLRQMARAYARNSRVLVLEPDLGEQIYALDFSHGSRLIRAGYAYALPRLRDWLNEIAPQDRSGPPELGTQPALQDGH